MRIEAPSSRDLYVESLYAAEDVGLRGVRERLIAAGRWGVNVGPVEGRLLQVLLRLVGAARVVEIGTLFGYSGVWMARALAPGGRLYTVERDAECARQARQSFAECEVADRVVICEGEALEQLALLQGPFDCVFIDANKSGYLSYLDWAVGALRPGGLLIADNTLMGGALLAEARPESMSRKQWDVMREFNSRLATSGEFDATMISTREGLSIGVRV